ncbi:MAG: nucleotidyltransferase family protein [Synergistaceae bacterium]|nr:nucleotidyltransferase family protein [Synergistaceae bacterium]
MRIAGITAEYNPLHSGHKYHIRKTREIAQAEAIITLISSNFTQRGEPSMVDKHARARMAVSCGADLALELPCAFSCRNAGIFADAAIDIFGATGAVGVISFGTESGDEKKILFERCADILNGEPAEFKSALKKFLGIGHSFVQSRSMALDELAPGALELLSTPNNNLAMAYIKRIREKKHPMETLHIRRIGAGFHERDTSESDVASASAIRGLIASGGARAANAFLPSPCEEILRGEIEAGHAVIGREKLWRAVRQMALRASPEELADIAEMREGLENRMRRAAYEAASMDEFVDICTSRRYPTGRIQRYCAHLLLNLRQEQSKKFQENGPAYIRVLAANETGREILRAMRKTATLPVLSKPGGKMSRYAWEIMSFERAASEIWETLTESPRQNAESRIFQTLSPRDFPSGRQ